MVLFSFSIPTMISKIKNGSKHQTTRSPRKSRKNGEPPYKVGDKVQLYYRSRQKKGCQNCLVTRCYFYRYRFDPVYNTTPCKEWTNLFGESEIIDIIHYHHGDYKERYHEIWMGHTISGMSEEDRETFAKADGFDSWLQASLFFSHSANDPMWMFENLDIIIWNKEPIIKRWQQK